VHRRLTVLSFAGLSLVAACSSGAASAPSAPAPTGAAVGVSASARALDQSAKTACSFFDLAGKEADPAFALDDIHQGLLSVQQSAVTGLAADLKASAVGATAKDQAPKLLAVCRRYGL
jgi:hypothetical protein